MQPFKYKPPTVSASNLKTPVSFYEYVSDTSPEPVETRKRFLFFGFAEVYNPSSKDIEILNNKGIGVTKSLTVRIRDTGGEYLPSNKHYFEVDDVYFSGEVYQIQSISLDSEMHNYMKVIGTLTV